jgi:hypothetical protein
MNELHRLIEVWNFALEKMPPDDPAKKFYEAAINSAQSCVNGNKEPRQ